MAEASLLHTGAGLSVRRVAPASLWQLRTRLAAPATLAALAAAIGIDALPETPCRSAGGDPRVVWKRPGTWMIRGALDADRVRAASPAAHLGEVTDAYMTYEIGGPLASLLLEKGCFIDVADALGAPGHTIQTRFAQLPVLIDHVGPHYALYAERSYDAYLAEWLIAAAGEPPETPA